MENELDKFTNIGLRQGDEYHWFLSMTKDERNKAYYRYLDNIMDQNGDFESAFDEEVAENRALGIAEGRAEVKLTVARNLLSAGLPISVISSSTGLSEEEIASIKV